MTDDPPRRRPTHTLIVPLDHVPHVVLALVAAHSTFTVAVEYRHADIWHIGLFADGLRIVSDLGIPVVTDSGRDRVGGFTCPRCGKPSSHPRDREYGYCGACHDFTA